MTYQNFIFMALLGCVFLPSTVLADQITLKNGDQVTGDIVSQSPDGMVLVKSVYGQLKIPANDIELINNRPILAQRSAAQPTHRNSGGRYVSRSAPYAPENKSAEYNYGSPNQPYFASAPNTVETSVQAALDEKTAESPQNTDNVSENLSVTESLVSTDVKWSGEVNVGAQIQRGNSDQERLNIDGKVELRRPKDRLSIYAEINQNENGGETTEDDRQLEFNYDYFLGNKWFLQGRVEFEQDDVAELDMRTIIQPSLGYQFYETDPLNLKVTGGMNFQTEEFSNGDTEDSVGVAWSLDYDQKVWNDIKIFHNHDITAPFDDFGAYLFESKSGIKAPVLGKLQGTAEIDFDYDAEPALGASKDDTIYRLKLGYAW